LTARVSERALLKASTDARLYGASRIYGLKEEKKETTECQSGKKVEVMGTLLKRSEENAVKR